MSDTYLLVGLVRANVWQVIKKATKDECELYLIENYESLDTLYSKLAIPKMEDFAARVDVHGITKPTFH